MTPVSFGNLWATDKFRCLKIGRRLYSAGSFGAQRQTKGCAEFEAVGSKLDILIPASALRVIRWLKSVNYQGKLIHPVRQGMLVFPIHDRSALDPS